MARLPYADPTHPECRAVAAVIRASRGHISHLYRLLLHAPPIAQGWLTFFDALRWHSTLCPRIRELVICRIAAISSAPLCLGSACAIGP